MRSWTLPILYLTHLLRPVILITMPRNQAADAQELYDDRSIKYDDSHHPRFARHMVELANPRAGERVLDLACGTGLVSYPASTAVGPSGEVIGVDISSGMLRQAEAKKPHMSRGTSPFSTTQSRIWTHSMQ